MSEVNGELILLRDFYRAWVALHTILHTIPRTIGNRKKQEEAAQELVDAAHHCRNFYAVENEAVDG